MLVAPDSQWGFTPGKGAHDAAVMNILHSKSHSFMISLDFSKAFDSIEPEWLKQRLRELHISDDEADFIVQFDSAGRARVSTPRGYTPWFNVERGSRQGGILSPLKCIIAIAPLLYALERLGFIVVAYADDITVFARSWERAELAVRTVASFAFYTGMPLNPAKCALVPLTDQASSCLRALGPFSAWVWGSHTPTVKEEHVPVVDSAVVLGFKLPYSADTEKYILDKIQSETPPRGPIGVRWVRSVDFGKLNYYVTPFATPALLNNAEKLIHKHLRHALHAYHTFPVSFLHDPAGANLPSTQEIYLRSVERALHFLPSPSHLFGMLPNHEYKFRAAPPPTILHAFSSHVYVYTDGSLRDGSGFGGVFIPSAPNQFISNSLAFGPAFSSTDAELLAIIWFLSHFTFPSATIWSDSEPAIKIMSKGKFLGIPSTCQVMAWNAHKVTILHVHSHKQIQTSQQLGNAVADSLASNHGNQIAPARWYVERHGVQILTAPSSYAMLVRKERVATLLARQVSSLQLYSPSIMKTLLLPTMTPLPGPSKCILQAIFCCLHTPSRLRRENLILAPTPACVFCGDKFSHTHHLHCPVVNGWVQFGTAFNFQHDFSMSKVRKTAYSFSLRSVPSTDPFNVQIPIFLPKFRVLRLIAPNLAALESFMSQLNLPFDWLYFFEGRSYRWYSKSPSPPPLTVFLQDKEEFRHFFPAFNIYTFALHAMVDMAVKSLNCIAPRNTLSIRYDLIAMVYELRHSRMAHHRLLRSLRWLPPSLRSVLALLASHATLSIPPPPIHPPPISANLKLSNLEWTQYATKQKFHHGAHLYSGIKPYPLKGKNWYLAMTSKGIGVKASSVIPANTVLPFKGILAEPAPVLSSWPSSSSVSLPQGLRYLYGLPAFINHGCSKCANVLPHDAGRQSDWTSFTTSTDVLPHTELLIEYSPDYGWGCSCTSPPPLPDDVQNALATLKPDVYVAQLAATLDMHVDIFSPPSVRISSPDIIITSLFYPPSPRDIIRVNPTHAVIETLAALLKLALPTPHFSYTALSVALRRYRPP